MSREISKSNLATRILCVPMLLLAVAAHARDVKIADLEPYLETKLTAAEVPCKNYYADVVALSPSTLDVNIYTTCSSQLKPDAAGKKFPAHGSEITAWRIDCPTESLAFVGAKYYRDRLWKAKIFTVHGPQGRNDKLVFGGINPFIQKLAADLCEELEDEGAL